VALSEMLAKDLSSIIELRNKLAHGQWVYPLNNDSNDVAQEQMDALRVENLLSLQFKNGCTFHVHVQPRSGRNEVVHLLEQDGQEYL
jgi:hypothetical protein